MVYYSLVLFIVCFYCYGILFCVFRLESEKFHEMVTATEAPPVNQLRLDDDGEFPPMVQKLD